jgi:Flp pilus assembly protein TadD
MPDELADIVYISVPEELARDIGSFHIDPERLLPVEVTGGADRYDLHDLSWEQIIAAMLKILAYAPDHEDADYYREFVDAVAPQTFDDLMQTAIIKARNGDFDIAEEIFLALQGLSPDDQRPAINLALLLEQRAAAAARVNDDDAEQQYVQRTFELYHTLLGSDDAYPEAHLNAAYFYASQHEYERAVESFTYYVEHGQDEEKQSAARKTVDEISSRNLLDTLFKQAYDYIRMGREEEGIERIRRFLTSYPSVWNGWFLLGWGLRRLGRFADARDAFLKSLELGPRQTDTLNELAICHMELGNLSGAKVLLTEAIALEPENTKIISNLGVVAMKEGDTDQAVGYFRTVLEIEPDDRTAARYLEQLTE